MVELRGDYWDIIEAALTSLPESSALREPALASFDHLKDRVLTNHRKDALAPDAVRLLIDMEPDLRKLAVCQIGGDMEGDPACCAGCHLASLLARLDRLGT